MVKDQRFDPHYLEFVTLFNQQKFFESHEVLEILWRQEKGRSKDFYHGLIQIAAAFVHVQKGTPDGAKKLLKSASRYLKPFEPFFDGIDLKGLQKKAQAAVLGKTNFPQINLNQKSS